MYERIRRKTKSKEREIEMSEDPPKMFAKSIYRVMVDPNSTDKQKVKYLERIDHYIDMLELGKE